MENKMKSLNVPASNAASYETYYQRRKKQQNDYTVILIEIPQLSLQ